MVRSAEAITAAVATLQKSAEWLEEEARRFRARQDGAPAAPPRAR